MATLDFREDKTFFEALDRAIERGESVTVRFPGARPDEKSKLWPRLRKCKNWSSVKEELDTVAGGGASPIASILAPKMAVGLTGGEILLIAWIATLIAGVFMYGIYKNRKVRFRGKKVPPEMILEVD